MVMRVSDTHSDVEPETGEEDKQVMIRLTPRLHRQVRLFAGANGLTVRKFVELAVARLIEEEKENVKELIDEVIN
jgi:predicted HicB family RNase H-like nuclease